MIVKAILEDITKIGKKADAIVNAANSDLRRGGGVCGSIFKAAGYELDKECAKLGGAAPGEAKATRAYNLDNKYIIHAVGPIYDTDPTPAETLERCYVNALKVADELGCESIAFPSISTGIYGYPHKEAAKVCAKALCNYEPKHINRVYMCIYKDESKVKLYNDAFEAEFAKNK